TATSSTGRPGLVALLRPRAPTGCIPRSRADRRWSRVPLLDDLSDVTVAVDDAHVATVEIHRPPDNYFDAALIKELGDAYETIDADPSCRVILLCSEGKHFCAGANLGGSSSPAEEPRALYREALRLFAAATPVVAAVQG